MAHWGDGGAVLQFDVAGQEFAHGSVAGRREPVTLGTVGIDGRTACWSRSSEASRAHARDHVESRHQPQSAGHLLGHPQGERALPWFNAEFDETLGRHHHLLAGEGVRSENWSSLIEPTISAVIIAALSTASMMSIPITRSS